MVPSAGPMKGSQYLTNTISGLAFFNALPTFIQFSGLIELMTVRMVIPSGGGSVVYWVVPGNKKDGYWSEKDQISQEWPWLMNAAANRSLNVVRPPLSGWAGPTMITFILLVHVLGH